MDKLQKDSNLAMVENCYQQYHDQLFRFVCARLHDVNESEDIVQDVFVRLLESDNLIAPNTMNQLVYKIAFNLMCDYWRHHKCAYDYEKFLCKELRQGGRQDELESIYAVSEINEFLERGIARLCDDDDRKLYRLNVYDGMKVSEIAQELNMKYKYVENHLGVARKSVRKYMKRMLA